MAKMFTLLAGTSKKNLRRIMTQEKQKCENYRDALKKTPQSKFRFFEIREATEDEQPKARKSNQWTNYNSPEPSYSKVKRVDRRG